MLLKEDFLTYISQEQGAAKLCRVASGSIRFGWEAEEQEKAQARAIFKASLREDKAGHGKQLRTGWFE